MPEIYLLPNCVPCSVCCAVYPLSHYAAREWDPRPVVCEPCHKQMDREDMYEGPHVTLSEMYRRGFDISEVELAQLRWMCANGKGRYTGKLNTSSITVIED